MIFSKLLKILQVGAIAFAFLFTTSAITTDALAKDKKPAHAGKQEESRGKGGRSEQAKQHGKNKEKKEKKAKKEKKTKKEKKAKKGKKGKKK